MAPTFSPLSLSLFFLLFTASPFSSATTHNNKNLFQSSALKSPQTQAQKFIRELNLFPKHKANIAAAGSSFSTAPRLVERKFTFPLIVDSGNTAEDLGHHAGYYKLPHSNDGR